MITMAVDVGFGRVKGVASNGNQVEFPSLIGEFHPVKFSSGMNGDPLSQIAVEYSGKRKFVGEAALRQSTPQNTIDPERTISEEGLLLLVTAMTMLTPNCISETINLVVGLPVMHYEKLKQRYIDAVKRVHVVDRLSMSGELISRAFLSVKEVKVLPQPIGTLFDCLFDGQGEVQDERLAEGKVGIIDVGYNTLDLARVDNLEFISPRSTSYSGLGMFSVFQALSFQIFRSFGVEIPPERIEPIFLSKQIRISGEVKDVSQLVIDACRQTANQTVSRAVSVWPDRWELDAVFLSGGGSIYIGDYIAEQLGQNARKTDTPGFSNVSGYLKFGQRIWKS